ncbi:LacI family DNA-binding transcriptional regulator [Rhodococcus jostii]|uniref:Transcriptional regulator, LacI family n=1 Tax=Rhodococcus jostii TaxID=132919 RepID=A0A1H4ITQ0_RHOJO|nr:LacI family DNA-binding transcriptional regulator [Rhodococcus jostii]SEB37450.1 transcriptional regulator, LacI family [Rhodococcus jostii]
MARKVRLSDVSRAAGVGLATVSRALGDHPDVSEATRERVRGVARELGYRPSVTARALRSGGFHAISAIVPDAGWVWCEPVVRAAFKTASAEGYQLMVHPVAGTPGGAAAIVEGLANVPTEGVIVISVPDQDAVREACDRIALPGVAIDDTSRKVRFPTVSPRNREGARIAVEHLIGQGRRSIALLSVDLGTGSTDWGDGLFIDERAAGYRDALDAAGIAHNESLVIDCDDFLDEARPTLPALAAALERGAEIDAIFCIADLLAAPALRTLRAHGLRVPEDVSLIGFDDERAAGLVDPQLTTMRQPYAEMGRLAVELLLRSIRGEELDAQRHEIDTQLVERASTTPRLRPAETTCPAPL